jgi:hypothetical protein
LPISALHHDAIRQVHALVFRNGRGEIFSVERREVEFRSGRIPGQQKANETVAKTAMTVIKHSGK